MIKIIKDSQLINQTAEVSLSVASPAKDGDDSLSDKPPSEENQGGAALGDSESVTDAGKAGTPGVNVRRHPHLVGHPCNRRHIL